MGNDILSQEEIDALLSGSADTDADANPSSDALEDEDKDLLGEVGNICMGSAATTLSILINQPVSITTPKVKVITLNKLKESFDIPNVCIEVRFMNGLAGANLLVLKVPDAEIIADLMMGGKGDKKTEELSEIQMSAVSEAMNQMIGTAATSMATMFSREVNISPPDAHIWDNRSQKLSQYIDQDDELVQISFRLTIGKLVDSIIMLLLSMDAAKEVIDAMTAAYKDTPAPAQEEKKQVDEAKPAPEKKENVKQNKEDVQVHKAEFTPLQEVKQEPKPRNIDLILDVPIEISVILGKSNKTIKDILELNNGSLIELDKLVEEPVDILVNGKMVAQGEVVVVNENFGVRITNIISNEERVKGFKE